jgi:hypothetical protein
MHSVQKYDTKETIDAERKRFYELVKKYPNIWREFVNENNGEHLIYNCSTIIPFDSSKGTSVVNLNNFLKSVDILRNERKMKKKYYACIFKSMIEGLWGKGFEKMAPEVFCAFMLSKGIDVGQKSNIYKYKPQGNYPNWHYRNNLNTIINKEDNNSVIARLMEIYNKLKKES